MPALLDPPAARRQAAQARRHQIQHLLDLARHLPARDRAMIEHVYARGLTVAELARLTRTSPRRIRRRLAAVLQRMRHPLFRFLIEKPDLVPLESRETVVRWTLHHWPMRHIARHRGISVYAVRLELRDATTLARLWGYR
jgi:AraC-like DNA-binding protein